jgi:hypothetical protein
MSSLATATDAAWVLGRDAQLPSWFRARLGQEGRPRYDSIVVRGNGVGAMTLAGRLARSRALAGRVVVAAPRPEESRRLVNGCTLRARSVDYYAAAFATTRERVLETIFGPRWPEAEAHRQYASVCTRRSDGSFRLENRKPWMDSRDHGGRALAYGTRNGRLVGALAELLGELPHQWVPELPASIEACRALAPGTHPLVINAAHQPLEGAPPRAKPTRFVVASQMTFTAPRRRALGLVGDAGSFVAFVPRDGRLDVGIYYPFVDPLSPAAEYYGIVYRIVDVGAEFDKAGELEPMHDAVVGVGRSFGLEPLDESETQATAMVPCTPWRDDASRHRDFLDFEAIYGAGAPIITGCGMARAGLAGFFAAEAILAGEDPVELTNRALKRWRLLNWIFAQGMTTVSKAGHAALPGADGFMGGRLRGRMGRRRRGTVSGCRLSP